MVTVEFFPRCAMVIALALTAVLSAHAQQTLEVLPGDVVKLEVSGVTENIRWQTSADGTNWTDVAGGAAPSLSYPVSSFPTYIRAEINEPDCDPRYSDTVLVQRLVELATVSTSPASNISARSFLVGGTISNDGGSDITDKGIVYAKTMNPTVNDTKFSKGEGTSPFSVFVEGLDASTTYHIRAYAVNKRGIAYGQNITINTLEAPANVTLPTVSTNTVTAITNTSATTGGNVLEDGGGQITARGIVFSTSSNPTLSNNSISSGTGKGSFETSLTGLSAITQYFVRAYATNAAGTAYGSERSFTTATPVSLPVLSTVTLSNLSTTSVTLSSSLTGSGNISAKGFVLSTSPSPTIANGQVVAATGATSFNGNATGLASGVVYFVRSYATNEAGTAYGAETTFRTIDSNVILMFVPHEQTYYTEYIVMRKALEASGYTVEVRSASTDPSTLYMSPPGTTVSATAATLPGGSHAQFTQQFSNLFGANWDESLDAYPATVSVAGRIQDVAGFGPYRAMVVVGGLGALAYRVDGSYSSQGTVGATEVQNAALKLNSLALEALGTGKPVMAQCHAASLPVFWRVPNTTGSGVESLGYSILKGQPATGFPEPETPLTLQPFGVVHRATNLNDGDRVTVASPHESFNDAGLGDFKIITTRDWYPQTVAHAARTLLNIISTYPTQSDLKMSRDVLILHGGAVNPANCSAANRANDVPCNYGNATAELPADYTDLQALLADSPNDDFNFVTTQVNISNGSLPSTQPELVNYFNNFDVIIFYKHWSTSITNTLLSALVSYADNGGGVLALHHGLYNDSDGSQNKDILVNQLFGASSAPWASLAEANRTTYRLFSTNYGHFISTYRINLNNNNLSLPAPAPWSTSPLTVMANNSYSYYQNFQLYDELYNNMAFNPGVTFGRNVNEITPLFSNDQTPSTQSHISGFVKIFNQSGGDAGRVAYFQPGERKENYSQSHPYGQVIRNAIVWLSN